MHRWRESILSVRACYRFAKEAEVKRRRLRRQTYGGQGACPSRCLNVVIASVGDYGKAVLRLELGFRIERWEWPSAALSYLG
jgi:hypothetical protein